MRLPRSRRQRAQREWNVPAHSSRMARSPTKIGKCALSSQRRLCLVNVTARMLLRANVALLNEVRDALGQGVGLARSGPGKDQHRPLIVQDRLLLRFVEAGKKRRDAMRRSLRSHGKIIPGRRQMPGLWKTPAKKRLSDEEKDGKVLARLAFPCPKDTSCRGFPQPRPVCRNIARPRRTWGYAYRL